MRSGDVMRRDAACSLPFSDNVGAIEIATIVSLSLVLQYLRRKDFDSYEMVIKRLGLKALK